MTVDEGDAIEPLGTDAPQKDENDNPEHPQSRGITAEPGQLLRATRRSPGHAVAKGTKRNRPATVTMMAVTVVAAPLVIAIVRLATLGHVYLSADLAVMDLRVRDALHFQQLLGPFDRFGWDHPGPAYFYLLAAIHLIVRDSGRTQFIGSVVVNLSCTLGTIWVVHRRAGRWAALWTGLCLGGLALLLSASNGNADQPLGVLLSPWNPNVVVFPLVLFGVLCAVGTLGSWAALMGASLVGSFVVQTDIGTLPLVTLFFVGSGVAAVIRTRHAKIGVPWRVLALGGAGTLLLWLPPLVQQVRSRRGNFTLLWRFFTAKHPLHDLVSSLKSVLATDESRGGPLHSLSDLHVSALLTGLAVVAVVCIVLGIRGKRPLVTSLGLASLLGFFISVYAATRIVGPVFAYLLQWEIAVPVFAVLGVGVAVLAVEPGALVKTLVFGAATVMTLVLSIAMIRLPMSHASNPEVAEAWHIVAPYLRHDTGRTVFLDIRGPLAESPAFWGLFDELEVRGLRPRTSSLWRGAVGDEFVSKHRQPVYVFLYPPSNQVERMPGYVGRIATADIVVSHSAS